VGKWESCFWISTFHPDSPPGPWDAGGVGMRGGIFRLGGGDVGLHILRGAIERAIDGELQM